MIIPKTREQIELMRESALLVSKTLGIIAKEMVPGVTTLHIDKLAEEFIRDHGGIPGFKGLYDFPNTLCVSPNAQVVHGIPNNIPLESGDVISVDCGVLKNNYYGDHAYSFEIGEVAPETKKLLRITKESLYIGIREFRIGNRVEDVGNAIQKYCEENGYGVVRELVGHGLGMKMHEDPEMPNYGKRGRGKLFVEGMVVAPDVLSLPVYWRSRDQHAGDRSVRGVLVQLAKKFSSKDGAASLHMSVQLIKHYEGRHGGAYVCTYVCMYVCMYAGESPFDVECRKV